jgi:hypothetical protein
VRLLTGMIKWLPMPERHLNFVYKLEGDVTEVNVFKLAPTLLALGELIREGNRQINPGGREIAVNVNRFAKVPLLLT